MSVTARADNWNPASSAPTDGTAFFARLKDRFGEYPFGPCRYIKGVLYTAKPGAPVFRVAEGVQLAAWQEYRS